MVVEPVGEFVALHFPKGINHTVPEVGYAANAVQEGDYIYLYSRTAANSTLMGDISSVNKGTFTIIKTSESADTVTLWIKNDNAIAETCECLGKILDSTSVIPGDKVLITGTSFGTANAGTWVVESIGLSGVAEYTTTTELVLSLAEGAPTAVSGVSLTGANAGNFKIQEGTPTTRYKKLITSMVDIDNPEITKLFIQDSNSSAFIKESLGSIITAMDKMAFPTTKIIGVDGYKYNTGLISEANKVVYGDPQDEATYPGYAAAGATINIQGPLVRKVEMSLSVRVNTALASEDLSGRIKSAVAAIINQAGIGESVAISQVVAAAADVPGVTAVAVLKPTYSSTNDLIPVNANEKLMVLDISTDINVVFVGI
jgi:hypothetical protein